MVSSKTVTSAVIFDFNGTLFLDTCFHMEAWSRIYKELRGEAEPIPDAASFCGPNNDDILKVISSMLTPEERNMYSVRKETIYRELCRQNPDKVHLTKGAAELLEALKELQIPFALASASIIDNIEFYFREFRLDHWFDRQICVYDDGTYANKGQMHMEAARRLGAAFSDCIVIEDSIGSINYARENGAKKIIGIGSDSIHPELIRAGATHCIRDFTEFNLEWLKD